MGNHDDFDLDVRLGNGRNSMEASQPLGNREGNGQTDPDNPCGTNQTNCQQYTCNADYTCDCPSQQPAQDTCSTCVTQCNPHTCGDDTCSGHTCNDLCPTQEIPPPSVDNC